VVICDVPDGAIAVLNGDRRRVLGHNGAFLRWERPGRRAERRRKKKKEEEEGGGPYNSLPNK
jgi:hypothetical protein